MLFILTQSNQVPPDRNEVDLEHPTRETFFLFNVLNNSSQSEESLRPCAVEARTSLSVPSITPGPWLAWIHGSTTAGNEAIPSPLGLYERKGDPHHGMARIVHPCCRVNSFSQPGEAYRASCSITGMKIDFYWFKPCILWVQ